jgi:hypothetical protein
VTNPIRTCPVCVQTDDHPRHVTDLNGEITLALHMDCCAIARDCQVCQAQLHAVGGADGNPKGDKLRAHLLRTGPDAEQPGWTTPVLVEE